MERAPHYYIDLENTLRITYAYEYLELSFWLCQIVYDDDGSSSSLKDNWQLTRFEKLHKTKK